MRDEEYQRSRERGRPSGGRSTRGTSRRSAGRVRIVAGELGGRRIPVPDAPGLRPTPERTRETLFNWLQGAIAGARVLDLYAGSGALSLEALSRGAAHATLIENDRRVADALRATCDDLAPDRTRVIRADALQWLNHPNAGAAFDLVFLDPPFSAHPGPKVLHALATSGTLAEEARVYLEQPARGGMDRVPEGWTLLRETRAGDSMGMLVTKAP